MTALILGTLAGYWSGPSIGEDGDGENPVIEVLQTAIGWIFAFVALGFVAFAAFLYLDVGGQVIRPLFETIRAWIAALVQAIEKIPSFVGL